MLPQYILSIETSCDDTAAAILMDGVVLSNVISSQTDHKLYGGVVPEVASRAHDISIMPVVRRALDEAEINLERLNAVACTIGPGLMGSLMVGFCFAKSLAYALKIPLVGVHHMEAHVLSHFIEDPKPSFPFLCLTVSGGHTQLVMVKSSTDMEVIGKTLDDAAGEAFDKGGKIMGLDYPAGPEIDRRAEKGSPLFDLSRPRIAGFNYSFSGLKTSFLYLVRDQIKRNPRFVEDHMNDLCASLQSRIVDILMEKFRAAAEWSGVKEIAIAGGVAANSGLRMATKLMGEEMRLRVFLPRREYCTDNAAMIGIAGWYKLQSGESCALDAKPDPRQPFGTKG